MDVGTNDQSYFGCKYLTSAQLFQLQLHDPFIRMQLLLQLLIYFQRFVIVILFTRGAIYTPYPLKFVY